MSLRLLPAFLRRDLAIQLSYRADLTMQTASVLLTLVLFFYVGEFVDDSDIDSGSGFDTGYFGFVVIGLALFRILSASMNSFAGRLRSEQTSGTLEAMLASPVRPSVAILLSAAFDLIRATFYALLMIVAAVALFGLHLDTSPLGLLVSFVTVLGSLALFASVGMLLASFTVVYKQSSAALALVTTGIAVFSGVYFPVSIFPSALQAVGELIPMTWAVDVSRSALLSGEIEVGRLILLLCSAAVILSATLWMIERAVGRARDQGSLGHY